MQLYMSWYIRSFFGFTFLNIFYFFKYYCTNILHRRIVYTFYGKTPMGFTIIGPFLLTHSGRDPMATILPTAFSIHVLKWTLFYSNFTYISSQECNSYQAIIGFGDGLVSNRHIIARPLRWGMGCFSGFCLVQTLIDSLPPFVQCCVQYHAVLDRGITALDCNCIWCWTCYNCIFIL